MTGTLMIRKASSTDAQAVFDIRNAAINSHCVGHYPARDLEIWTAGTLSEHFVTMVDDIGYVALVDDWIVGTGMIDLESGQIDAIFVKPTHMGQGVGRQMMVHLERLALDAGLAHVKLDATLNAAVFYRTCGFVGELIEKYESPRGISLDSIPMIKRLVVTGVR